jgi:hypothetical protein
VTTKSPEDDGPAGPPQRPSRLEREVAEILERTENQPISFTDEVRRRANARRQQRVAAPQRPPAQAPGNGAMAAFERLGEGRYLVVAVVAAVLALVLSDVSPLLATLLAIVCVVSIFIPIVQRFRQPEGPATKTWRGRDMSIGGSRPEGIERIFNRFRRPPRI